MKRAAIAYIAWVATIDLVVIDWAAVYRDEHLVDVRGSFFAPNMM